jgi:hypothetical protein
MFCNINIILVTLDISQGAVHTIVIPLLFSCVAEILSFSYYLLLANLEYFWFCTAEPVSQILGTATLYEDKESCNCDTVCMESKSCSKRATDA